MFTDNLWWFKPNEHTTRWELISHWVDEDRNTVYELIDGSWELTDSHDDRLTIETPYNQNLSHSIPVRKIIIKLILE